MEYQIVKVARSIEEIIVLQIVRKAIEDLLPFMRAAWRAFGNP